MKSKLIIDEDGNKYWKLPNGDLHREDGPAIEYIDGDKYWYINGQSHREDGPAIEFINSYKSWYLNNIRCTKKEYKYKMRFIKLNKLLK
jgi:hypothetical protein